MIFVTLWKHSRYVLFLTSMLVAYGGIILSPASFPTLLFTHSPPIKLCCCLQAFSGAYLISGNLVREAFNRNIINLLRLRITHLMLSFSFCCVQIPPTSSKSRSVRSSWSGVMPTAADFSAKRAAALYRLIAVSSLRKAGSVH